jgi:chromosome segregation ATPase
VNDEFHDTRDQRASVAQAAQMLGISEGAVRKRVERGKLRAEHDNAGRLIVYLDATTTDATHDTTHDRPRQSRGDRYTRSLEEQVEYLRGQLDQERNASAELRQIVAGLTQANAEHARTIREIEAPTAQESTDAAETAEETPEGTEPRSAEGEAREELDAERARREMAESTLREGMAEQRRRREEAERERDELRRQMYARREPGEPPQTADAQQGRGQPQSAMGRAQEAAEPRSRAPWWRRIIGR